MPRGPWPCRVEEAKQEGAGGGEFYTPRAVTQFAIEMVDPEPGENILDPALMK